MLEMFQSSFIVCSLDIPLIECENVYFNSYLGDYERVPILIGTSSVPSESIMPQYMGQWIYFRQNNPYTNKSLYLDTTAQRQYDLVHISAECNCQICA